MNRVNLWCSLTGGGSAVEYLRWLAAMWELYLASDYGAGTPARLPMVRRADEERRFNSWLVAKVNNAI